ncbi:uncharacterized protein [Dendrobates tinctorius]|uniref:uncharacterized protein isoform X1 n=1 Tax=Dendrobates tinctorius TaxID=92724 RepID=UPI003CCA05F4
MASFGVFSFNEEERSSILSTVRETDNFLNIPTREVKSRDYEKELKKLSSFELHAYTLAQYTKAQRIPRGLRVSLRPTLFSDNEEYCQLFENILNKCSIDLMVLTIKFLQENIQKVKDQVAAIENQLTNTLSPTDLASLKARANKTLQDYTNELKTRKKNKFLRDQDDYLKNQVYRWRYTTLPDGPPYRNRYGSSGSSGSDGGQVGRGGRGGRGGKPPKSFFDPRKKPPAPPNTVSDEEEEEKTDEDPQRDTRPNTRSQVRTILSSTSLPIVSHLPRSEFSRGASHSVPLPPLIRSSYTKS